MCPGVQTVDSEELRLGRSLRQRQSSRHVVGSSSQKSFENRNGGSQLGDPTSVITEGWSTNPINTPLPSLYNDLKPILTEAPSRVDSYNLPGNAITLNRYIPNAVRLGEMFVSG